MPAISPKPYATSLQLAKLYDETPEYIFNHIKNLVRIVQNKSWFKETVIDGVPAFEMTKCGFTLAATSPEKNRVKKWQSIYIKFLTGGIKYEQLS